VKKTFCFLYSAGAGVYSLGCGQKLLQNWIKIAVSFNRRLKGNLEKQNRAQICRSLCQSRISEVKADIGKRRYILKLGRDYSCAGSFTVTNTCMTEYKKQKVFSLGFFESPNTSSCDTALSLTRCPYPGRGFWLKV